MFWMFDSKSSTTFDILIKILRAFQALDSITYNSKAQ